MKLAYVVSSRVLSARTGSLVHVAELLKALKAQGVAPSIFASYEPRELRYEDLLALAEERPASTGGRASSSLRESLAANAVSRKLVESASLFDVWRRDVRSRGFFVDRLAQLAPDALYQRHHVFTTAPLEAAQKLGLPIILEMNAPIFYEENLPFRFLVKANDLRAAQLADVVIVVSHHLKDVLTKLGIPGGKVRVMPNAADVATFDPTRSAEPVRRKLGLDGRLVVGFVGSFKPWHGVDRLLGIADALRKGVPDSHLLLVGDHASLRDSWRKFVEERSDWITLTGPVPHAEVPAHLSAMDIALIPHATVYGSPMKTFEYMSMARAIAAPRVGPIEDVIADGESGLLFRPGDERDLLEKVLSLARDAGLRERLGARARARVADRFTWARSASEVVRLVEKLR